MIAWFGKTPIDWKTLYLQVGQGESVAVLFENLVAVITSLNLVKLLAILGQPSLSRRGLGRDGSSGRLGGGSHGGSSSRIHRSRSRSRSRSRISVTDANTVPIPSIEQGAITFNRGIPFIKVLQRKSIAVQVDNFAAGITLLSIVIVIAVLRQAGLRGPGDTTGICWLDTCRGLGRFLDAFFELDAVIVAGHEAVGAVGADGGVPFDEIGFGDFPVGSHGGAGVAFFGPPSKGAAG